MAQPEKFRFYLKDSFGTYYTVDAGGFVSLSLTKTPIKYAPKGWKATQIRRKRSLMYMGILTEMSTPYQFVLDGATILRFIFYAAGPDAECVLEIEKLNNTNWLYAPYYVGDIDFKSFSDSEGVVEVEIVQGGVNALIERNAKKTYEIDLLQSDSSLIAMDGMSLRNRSVLQHKTLGPPYFVGNQISPAVNVFSNESNIGIAVIDRPTPVTGTYGDAFIDKAVFFRAPINGNVEFAYSFNVNLIDTGVSPSNPLAEDFDVFLLQKTTGGTKTTHSLYHTNGFGSPATSFGNNIFAGTKNITVAQGDAFSLIMLLGLGNGTAIVAYNVQLGQMTLTYNTRAALSYCRAYQYHKVTELLMDKVSEGQASLIKTFLESATSRVDNRPLWTWLAPAEGMRDIPDVKYKVSWEKLFQDLKSRWGLAMGVSGNGVKLAPLAEFFEDTQAADLGTVSGLIVMPALELLFSTFKVGDTAGDNDALQGRYEINAPQEWAVSPTKTEGEYNMLSDFISGMYTLENIRVAQRGKDTTDKKQDGRICVIETNSTVDAAGAYPLYRPQNSAPNYAFGLIDNAATGTAYNLTLTPARNILRNKSTFAVQLFFNRAGKKLKFISAERDGFLSSDFGSGQIIDRLQSISDIEHVGIPAGGIRDFSEPPFLPVLFKFRCEEPDGLYAALEANPNGYLKFRCSKTNTYFKGFIFELIHHPGDNSALDCVLLAHPETDLSTLATL